MTKFAAVTPADDSFHTPTANPRWSESGWFGFHIPERQITGWVYMYHRTNQNHKVAGVALWDPSGEQTWNCLFHDWHDNLPVSPDENMYDYKTDNSLEVRTVETFKQYRLTYTAEGLDMDLTWTARFDPFLSGLPEGMQDWAQGGAETGHFEQGGRMTGTIKLESLGGEELTVDCWSVRDRSWGPRVVTPQTPRGANPWAASETCSFFINAFSSTPSSEDPFVDTTERVISGHYWADGKSGNLTDGTYRCTERDADGRPLVVVIEATDTLGRKIHAEGRAKNWLWWHGLPHTFIFWSLGEWTINGEHAWGNVIEWYPSDLMRRYQRTKARALESVPG